MLIDPHGRRVRKLRVSLTDKCNLRCHYCMPLDATFMDESAYLSANEYVEIVEELCGFGLEEVRLTGGEPLLRKSFAEIARGLGRLPLKRIGLTTNGVLLDRHFPVLLEAGIRHLNVSLDSLEPETFRKVTHGNHLARVVANIERAVELGFQVKVNAVAMRGVNDHELFAFAAFAARLGIGVRFLELMRIGHALDAQAAQFISAGELLARLRERFSVKLAVSPLDSTSVNYAVTGEGLAGVAEMGFIASESNAFCGQCSRWRLSADGIFRACLFKDDGLSARGKSPEERAELYRRLLGMKPYLRPAEVTHAMNAIGG